MTRRSIPWFAATLGLLMLFGKMFASGMALYPTDPADPRYSEVVFEHSWRWVKGEVPEGYFELPMGYPVEHMLAHSEPMLSFAPVFWMFRAMTFAPSTSHQLWMFAIALLNFVAFYLLMKHSLRLDSLAASAAGFLFAFGLPRVAQMGHSQLWPQFYIVLVLWGVHAMLSESASARSRQWGAPAVIVGFVLQAWGCLYNGVFLVYACLAVGLFALLHSSWRSRALGSLRETRLAGIACIVIALICLLPLLQMYLPIAGTTAAWDEVESRLLQPRLGSLLYVWNQSWFYSWMTTRTSLGQLPALHEQALGMGFLTTGVVLYTWVRNWGEPAARAIALVIFLLFLPVIMWPGDLTLWPILHGQLPGLSALRATSRLGILLLIPASAALGVFLQQRSLSGRREVWIAITALCLLEQGSDTRSFLKEPYQRVVQQIADNVDPEAEAFYYIGAGLTPHWFSQIDAIAASQLAGVPTINMYAARTPKDYAELKLLSLAKNPAMVNEIGLKLDKWIQAKGIDPDRVQRIVQYEFYLARDKEGKPLPAPE